MFFSIATNDDYKKDSEENREAPMDREQAVISFADVLVESHNLHEYHIHYY